MKVSELIKALETVKKEHGEIEVRIPSEVNSDNVGSDTATAAGGEK